MGPPKLGFLHAFLRHPLGTEESTTRGSCWTWPDSSMWRAGGAKLSIKGAVQQASKKHHKSKCHQTKVASRVLRVLDSHIRGSHSHERERYTRELLRESD